MTSRESEVLNTIYRLGGQCSIREISRKIGISPHYCELVSKALLGQKLVRRVGSNAFILTSTGKLFLGKPGDNAKGRVAPALTEAACQNNEVYAAPSYATIINPTSTLPEADFVRRELTPQRSSLVGHSLNRAQIMEVVDARQIQTSIQQLTNAGNISSKRKGRSIKKSTRGILWKKH